MRGREERDGKKVREMGIERVGEKKEGKGGKENWN